MVLLPKKYSNSKSVASLPTGAMVKCEVDQIYYYTTYNIMSYTIVLTVYSGFCLHHAWPVNILDYTPVSDISHITSCSSTG